MTEFDDATERTKLAPIKIPDERLAQLKSAFDAESRDRVDGREEKAAVRRKETVEQVVIDHKSLIRELEVDGLEEMTVEQRDYVERQISEFMEKMTTRTIFGLSVTGGTE
jgi:hypothetical protein